MMTLVAQIQQGFMGHVAYQSFGNHREMGEEQVKKTIKYFVSGEADTMPVNLPDGLKVEERLASTNHDKLELVTMGGNDVSFEEDTSWNQARIRMEVPSYSGGRTRFFSPKQARELGEWLIEVADSHKPKPKLRAFSDGYSADKDGLWYEVKPGWCVFGQSRFSAEQNYKAEGSRPYGRSYNDLVLSYGQKLRLVSE